MINKYFNDKPKAFINKELLTINLLIEMLQKNPQLYNECIKTNGFSFGFSQIANRAIHFDYLYKKGLIPKDYLEDIEVEE